MNAKTKKIVIIAAAAVAVAVAVAAAVVLPYFVSKAESDARFYVYPDMTAENLADSIAVSEGDAFAGRVATLLGVLNVDVARRVGAYDIEAGESPLTVARRVRNRSQVGVKFTFQNVRTKEQLAERAAAKFLMTKEEMMACLNDSAFCAELGVTPTTIPAVLMPDTYEFFIDESASSVVRKFLENGDAKFTEKYKEKCKKMGYTPYEIITIASIVEKEAANDEQKKTIAAILLNRLKDKANFPTLGCQSTSDYITNKVAPNLSSTSSHTADYYMAYYNTNNSSTVVGLPAGPICNPGIASINAVLYPAKTSAKFFFHDTKGTMYTAETYAEFKSKVQRYAPYLEY